MPLRDLVIRAFTGREMDRRVQSVNAHHESVKSSLAESLQRRRLARSPSASRASRMSGACQVRVRRPALLCVKTPAMTRRSIEFWVAISLIRNSLAMDFAVAPGWRSRNSFTR